MVVLQALDIILYSLLSLMVLYLLVFGLSSLLKKPQVLLGGSKINKIAVLFPAYNEDRVIISSVSSFSMQNYPADCYDIIVISDHMTEETNERLRQQRNVEVLVATYENSTKAKALNLAMDHIEGKDYDLVVVMDADNIADTDFLHQLNTAYQSGLKVIQTHRIAKNLNTDVAMLDAVSEEINNAFFRLGTYNLGLSASLIGSGIAFDFEWFKKNVRKLHTAGEDREFEVLLLRDRIRIGYLPSVYVYDEKTQNLKNFKNQRKRWQAVQYQSLNRSILDLPHALSQGNIDYANKILQWMLLPRSILLMLLPLISLIFTLFFKALSLKWWVLTLVFYGIIFAVIPPSLKNKRLLKAMSKIPVMAVLMCVNFLKLKEGSKKFIHTEHDVN
ncbi:glycosyltransferase family 2 protein [Parabacteroides sp. PF5-6]|uniref:glycosyltransferase n=1 Tax=Parabacteroides sp. PF5-6 TaxID=1742403 RepID=UPI0024061699|nr:glycosyltransferase family 2 protein [Parabacteroides sp. PF5-6]MDF9831729.1 cellulose synthase/poly-beta-1,6-N-acetylglucosamine synthase-like glycosyltransferase [Parabacteroides sp. PF5-6]